MSDGMAATIAHVAPTAPVPRWRLLSLFVRARGVVASAALVLATCGLLPILADWAGNGAIRQALLMQAIPVLIAAVIGVSAWSPFGESERTAARSLPALRAAHIGTLLVVGIGLSAWLVSRWTSLAPDVALEAIVARNIIGMSGAAFVVGRVLDARLSWLAPLTMGIVASSHILGAGQSDLDRMWHPDLWLWSGQASDAVASWLIALLLGLVGIGGICGAGPRDAGAEDA